MRSCRRAAKLAISGTRAIMAIDQQALHIILFSLKARKFFTLWFIVGVVKLGHAESWPVIAHEICIVISKDIFFKYFSTHFFRWLRYKPRRVFLYMQIIETA